ncbi:MAG: glycosyltransferase family 4 protein [Oscillospiraceae bacterium]|jgi:glycosyltransferase involved in cell wall biosynthesis|nr:glycosyltransferase family 4 protein [Oscillospiraceae bacterium]MCI1990264.1 glycosyltransferase family 4 protein [Oscillospiraceae bacterium]MCI2035474.1 glycosyltransferase family 4 protein [Oscillospiraceae bacterium]
MQNRVLKIGFLSTYPPRECGIATFTQDLVRALKQESGLKTGVIAISDKEYRYGGDVLFEFPQQDRKSYADAAERINRSDLQALVVEHEYGIYGGDSGEYLRYLLGGVKKPVVATLHTVLPEPKEKEKEILQALCRKSEKVVTMAGNTRRILRDVYGVEPGKITVIPHGVPAFDVPPREELKKQAHLENRTVVSTFGLISPGKGLEYGIEAVARAAKKHPEVLYLILGRTHPVVVRQEGEAYRERLEKAVDDLGVRQNVRFVNKYLTKEELVRYLQLSDIYMTPYLAKDQAVSGTLAYAAGYGRVIVSTPYLYAQEMLADGRGMLAKFRDADSLAGCINFLIEHPDERKSMEQKTLRLGREMTWDRVAGRYAETFREVCRSGSEGAGGADA